MTREELLSYVSKYTSNALLDNADYISEKLAKSLEDETDINVIYPTLVASAISIATQISVQSTFGLLKCLGLVIPEDFEKPLEKPLLKIVWNASDHQNED